MTAQYEEYRDVLERIPHVKRAEIVEDGSGGVRVQVVSHSLQSPRHLVREILSLLRTSGWHDINADDVMLVQIQQEEETRRGLGRLRIGGFAVTFGTSGYHAECRLTHGGQTYDGQGSGATSVLAVARAAVAAVNGALGRTNGLQLLEATEMPVSGLALSIVLAVDEEGELMAGNAVHREATPEETMIRAVLDAINRRFVLYTGQKF